MATSPWYREGTAKFTEGSTTVTGTGTRWVDFVRAGDGIQGPDGKLYQVTNVASNTSVSITPAYGNETTYWTIPIQGYVKRLADAASQLVRDFEGGAVEAIDAADRAKQSATEASASEAAALSQANRAESEADRAETEADRAQQAADDAVAVVTDGGGSIEPEAGKWPIAGAEGTIKQAWVDSLEFALDKLRAATNKALYGDGPYPVIDLQFQGAKYLDPRIQFTRASKDWDENGQEYGVDEPVLTDKGLWGSGVRANLLTESKDFLGWSVTPAASLARGYGQSPFNWGRSALFKQAENTTGSPYFHRTATAQQYTEGVMYTASLYVKPLASNSSNNPIRVILHQQMFESQCNVGLTPDGQISKGSGATFVGCDPAGNGFYRIWVTGKAATTGTSWAPIAWPLRSMLEEGEGWEVFGMQLEEGISPTSYIPTEASQVTVADGVLNSIRTDRLRSVVIDLELLRNLIDNNTLYILSWGTNRTGNIPTNGIMVWVAGFTNSIQVRIYTNGSYMSRTIPGNWEDLRKLGVSIFPDKIVVAADGVVREIETDRDVVDEAIFANLHPATHAQSKYRWLKSAAFYERALTTEQLQELTTL